MIVAVITGDIIGSGKSRQTGQWLTRLKESFRIAGAKRSEVFRGDSFQLELRKPERALEAALIIRTSLKAMTAFYQRGMDVRVAVGIGQQEFKAKKVSESNGEAYRFSGRLLDKLKSAGGKMGVRTAWPDVDWVMQPSLGLVSAIMDDWTHASSEIAWLYLSKTTIQRELSHELGISQPSVHKRLVKSHISELNALADCFSVRVRELLNA